MADDISTIEPKFSMILALSWFIGNGDRGETERVIIKANEQ